MNDKFSLDSELLSEYDVIIYLVRHGESVGNLNKVCLGHTNLPLTDKGVQQANITADYLSQINFTGVYSSDLCRAFETARPHALKRGLNVVTDDRLRELYFGLWENQAVATLEKDYGDLFWGHWRARFGEFTIPGGEAVVDGADRLISALVDISSNHLEKASPSAECQSILVASHAAVIRGAWARISGFEPALWAEGVLFPTNASFSLIGVRDGSLYPIRYSVDEHLGELCTGVQHNRP